MTKNDVAWELIFNKLNIVDRVEQNGFFDISANQIKEFGNKREPRLMTKFDFKQSLPKLFKDNKLSILAIQNGTYRLAKTNPYIDVSENLPNQIKTVNFPSDIISLNPFEITTESNALDIAQLSGILDEVFEEKTQLTLRGSFSRGVEFDFSLKDITNKPIKYNIQGVSIEIDGGYEGNNSLNLIEAKIGGRDNINIRQSLYPELHLKNVLNSKKRLRNYIFYYQAPIFRFIPFIYEGGICRADEAAEKGFKIKAPTSFNFHEIEYTGTELVNSEAPFPQANRFDKVIDILSIVTEQDGISKEDLKEKLASNYGLDERQTDYYSNVLKWMNICDIKEKIVELTDLGKKIVKMEYFERMKELTKIIFSEKICNIALKSGMEAIPEKLFSEKWHIDSATIPRRKQSIKSWIAYFEEIFE